MVQHRSGLLVLACALVLVALAAPRAQAKTCGAYTNQAAAQRGQDTRDADGDGILCEALPCPCLLPQPAPGRPRPTTPSAPRLGRSISLARATRRSGCHARGGLPDPRCTPGARFSRVTRATICRPGYASSVRDVSTATKDAVYGAYGLRRHFDGRDGEVDHIQSGRRTDLTGVSPAGSVDGMPVAGRSGSDRYVIDHLVPLEIGGSNAVSNLWPERADDARRKDRLEDSLHRAVCAGRTSVRRAQRIIARNWVAAFPARR